MHERQQLSEEGMFIVVASKRPDRRASRSAGRDLPRRRQPPGRQRARRRVIEVVKRTLQRTASRRITDLGELKNEIQGPGRLSLATYPKAPDHPAANS